MTREEAIKSALKYLVRKQQDQGSWGYADNDDTHEVSWDEIIEWIDQQPCGDCISRQAARNALLNKGQHSKRYKLGETWELNLMEIEEAIAGVPPVEPERKPGKWLYCVATNDPYGKWKCSECGKIIIAGRLQKPQQKFCPNCGAKMEVDTNGTE